MPFECPHCAKAIGNAVSKEDMTSRINAKNAEVELLKKQSKDLSSKLKDSESLTARVQELEGELRGTRRKAALAAQGITDEKVIRTLELVYDSEMAGRDEGDRVDFSDFGWAKEHPLFSSLFQAGDEGDQGKQLPPNTPAPQNTPGPKVPNTPGQQPPARQGKMTPEQLGQYFASDEFKALKPEDKRAKMTELKSQVYAPGEAA